jgi:hypothetical protein
VTKAQRRKLHRSINGLSPQDVAGIVKQSFPRAKGGKIDQLAKAVIANAHRQVSPSSQGRQANQQHRKVKRPRLRRLSVAFIVSG